MSPTLQILWESASPGCVSDSFQQKADRFLLYEAQITEQLGLQFTMQLESAWDELHGAELDRAFEQGFLTAFRLWMEVSGHSGGLLESNTRAETP